MDKKETFAERFLRAFKEADGTEDKEVIAKILGYKTKGAIYKILSGRMQLNHSALIKFRDYTNRTIDWLLMGEGSVENEQKESVIFSVNEVALMDMMRGVVWEEIERWVEKKESETDSGNQAPEDVEVIGRPSTHTEFRRPVLKAVAGEPKATKKPSKK